MSGSLPNCLGVPGGENSYLELTCPLRSPALQRPRRVCGFNVALAVPQSQSTPKCLQIEGKLIGMVTIFHDNGAGWFDR